MDLALSKRLERTEGLVGASFIRTRQRLAPEQGATWREIGGVCALFDGADSPMTQTFGLGVARERTAEQLAELEAFFFERGADTMHEVSPLGGVGVPALLVARGYQPIELSTVLVQELADATAPSSPELRARVMTAEDRNAWVEASVAGWSDDPAVATFMRPIAETASANEAMTHFLVEHAGQIIATASMGIFEGTALLAGASTIPSGRGLGAQALVLAARLAEAKRRACDIAMMVAAPGSTSQRNAERRGFRVAYTRTKWRLARK
ncbi:MAG: hypothetical protein SFX73_23590 [Kofleriaceae bacterium]|nr:hypothetical protein [Kofleriaceae bacterium]